MWILIVNVPGLKDVGLLTADDKSCSVNPHDDAQAVSTSSKYQTLTGSAARLVWVPWTTPNPPPTGAVAVSEKPVRFLATDHQHSMVGYLDPKSGNGAVVFPKEPQSEVSLEALVLIEIEPDRYELFDLELKRDRGFSEEEIILNQGHLTYELPRSKYEREDHHDRFTDGHGDSEESEYETEPPAHAHHQVQEPMKGRIESVLSYDISEYDYWGSGHLMAKGLPTFINLPREWTPREKSIEWGLPFTKTRKSLFLLLTI